MPRYGRVTLALSVVAGVVAAACESASLVSDGVDAGAGGAAIGEAGVEGGGDGGENLGGGGAAGAGEERPVVVVGQDCNGNPVELDQEHVRTCVMLTSCTPGWSPEAAGSGGFGRLTHCLSDWPTLTSFAMSRPVAVSKPLRLDARLTACTQALTSCEDLFDCAGFRFPISECEGDVTARCEGDLAINCGDQAVVIDCHKTTGLTESCQVIGAGDQARAVCALPGACYPQEEQEGCLGDLSYTCEPDGVRHGHNCAQFGLTCQVQGPGNHACLPPLPIATCTDLREIECSGTRQRICSPDGIEFTHDCASAGNLSCWEGTDELPSGGVILWCTPAGCPRYIEDLDECDGDDVVSVFGDVGSLRLHCPDYGFATCRDGVCADEL